MNKNLHSIQASILRELLFNNGATFSSLNKTKVQSDHFTFHLKHLVESEIVERKGKLYFLTQKGKLFANKLDIFELKMESFGTPSVAVAATKVINGQIHYLVQERLKEPLYGYWGFLNGKVKFGELVEETAKRELFEETGLKGNPKVLTINHWLRGPKRSQIRLDHYFFICLVKDPKGKLKNTREGRNFWKTEKEIIKLKTFPGFNHSLDVVTKGKHYPFTEKYIKVDMI